MTKRQFILSVAVSLITTTLACNAIRTTPEVNTDQVINNAALAPGQTISLPMETGEPLPIERDQQIAFSINDFLTPVFSGTLVCRTTTNPDTGTYDFFYRILESTTGLSGDIARIEVTNFAGLNIGVGYSDNSGAIPPTSVERSADGATVSCIFADPVKPGETSTYLRVQTQAIAAGEGGTVRLVTSSGQSATVTCRQPE